jgi:hypothetical protein
MGQVLARLAEDLINRARQIPPGDFITLGWFSGEGVYNFILKGFKISDSSDYQLLEQAVNNNKHVIGTTCFSEILAATEQVIDDLMIFSPNFALCFFTDGYPVVSNYRREVEQIYAAIAKMECDISSVLLVGYGDYYNKELMSEMAERFGGTLCHSGDLPAFNISLSQFVQDARENELKQIVDLALTATYGVVLSINGNAVTLYQTNEAGQIRYVPTKGSAGAVYVLTDQLHKDMAAVEITADNLQDSGVEPLIKAAYAAAVVLTQRTKTDLALEVLAYLGDKALIDGVNNAFTNAEYGKAEAAMQAAVVDKNARFQQGRVVGYLPAPDAFCILDLMDLLMADSQAYFYPYHPDFDYKRIGVPAKPKPGYPKFQPETVVKCALDGLTWNSTKLNLSLRAKINGSIALGEGYQECGLDPTLATFVYRNYTVVKDGFLNITRLPVSLSEATFTRLQHEGLIDATTVWEDTAPATIYLLPLDRVPVMNRAIASGKTSAMVLCRQAYQELQLEAVIKVLNFLKNELDPEGTKLPKTAYTPEQEAFLETQGVGRNGFAPPTEKEEASDKYFAKEFEIKIAKHSTLPKVDEVRTKLQTGKALNPPGLLIKQGLEMVAQEAGQLEAQEKLHWLDQKAQALKVELIKLRNEMQRTKFAIILGKRWFDEFTSREESTLQVDGVDYSIAVREVEVPV